MRKFTVGICMVILAGALTACGAGTQESSPAESIETAGVVGGGKIAEYLSEEEKLAIDEVVRSAVGGMISLVCFVPDERKDGGSYEEAEGTLRRIDPESGVLVLDDGRRIRIEDIVSAKKSCRG